MAIQDWEKDSDGNIKTYPVTGYEMALFGGMAIGLRIEYAESEADLRPGTPLKGLQVVLTPQAAEDLARALLRKAEQARSSPSGGSRQ